MGEHFERRHGSRAWVQWLAAVWAVAVLAAPTQAHAQLDVNRATVEELMQLPGIGAVRAERIIQARAQRPFSDWADLQARVSGIGPKTAQALSLHGLRVEGRSYGSDLSRGRAQATGRTTDIAKKNERSYH